MLVPTPLDDRRVPSAGEIILLTERITPAGEDPRLYGVPLRVLTTQLPFVVVQTPPGSTGPTTIALDWRHETRYIVASDDYLNALAGG